jgi:RNA polymerase sigma factor (TIGR02999 family)
LAIFEFGAKERYVPSSSSHDLTLLLHDWYRGDRSALDKIIPRVYAELRRLAHIYMVRERPGHMLQTTALINEAYLRLTSAGKIEWQNRTHFFAVSAGLMRRILVEFARARDSRKRAAESPGISFDGSFMIAPENDPGLIAIDDALNSLAKVDPRQANIVELRFFGGLTEEETAEVLGISRLTVIRDWKSAKLWLLHELKHRGK